MGSNKKDRHAAIVSQFDDEDTAETQARALEDDEKAQLKGEKAPPKDPSKGPSANDRAVAHHLKRLNRIWTIVLYTQPAFGLLCVHLWKQGNAFARIGSLPTWDPEIFSDPVAQLYLAMAINGLVLGMILPRILIKFKPALSPKATLLQVLELTSTPFIVRVVLFEITTVFALLLGITWNNPKPGLTIITVGALVTALFAPKERNLRKMAGLLNASPRKKSAKA